MKFTPKNEEELAIDGLLPEGTYDFEVIEAENKTSKSGNEMIVVKLKVYDLNGGFRFVTDYLLEAFLPKLLSFAVTTGTRKAYDAGEYTSYDVLNASGKVQIKIVPAGEYPAKNEVKIYGEPKAKGEGKGVTEPAPATFKPTEAIGQTVKELEEMDDIPF
jgi:hypothetical protein